MKPSQSTRRDFLRLGGAAIAAATLPGFLRGAVPEKLGGHVLLFTKSSGYEHSVVREKDGQPSWVENVLRKLSKKHGFELTASKDGRIFDGDLGRFDAFFFYTSGNLLTPGKRDKSPPMSARGKQALLDAVAGGKGFLGAHSASDSFHTPGPRNQNQEKKDPYIAMLGGEFISHGAQQKARMRVADRKFPGLETLGDGFTMHDEWYALKNFAPDLHVLLVNETEGMKGGIYQRPPFPSTWARRHGKGRVFYSAMAHREDVWTSEIHDKVIVGALAWAFGKVEADVSPNIGRVAPKASILSSK